MIKVASKNTNDVSTFKMSITHLMLSILISYVCIFNIAHEFKFSLKVFRNHSINENKIETLTYIYNTIFHVLQCFNVLKVV